MTPREELIYPVKKTIKDYLSKINISDFSDIVFSVPPDKKMGDFSFPLFQLAKKIKRSPVELSAELKRYILKESTFSGKVVNTGPYLNFYIKEEELVKKIILSIIREEELYGSGKIEKKVIIEHTSANPNGPFHIGRARNPIIGDTLARVMRHRGYDVTTEYYVNDVGLQMAVLKWGIDNIDPDELPPPDIDKIDHKLVRFYTKANVLMNSNKDVEERIRSILKGYENELKLGGTVSERYNLKKLCAESLEGMKESLRKLNIETDSYFYESELIRNADIEKIVNDIKNIKELHTSNGLPLIVKLGDYIKGRNTDITLIREDGTSLYTTRDLAYHRNKLKRADILINILGEDHKFQSKVLKTLLSLMGDDDRKQIIPIFYSFVTLPEGKMSTRKGSIVYLDDLVEEAVYRAKQEVIKRRGHIDEANRISQTVAVGAIRFNIIRVQNDKNIVFKWEDALNMYGFSAPYVMYAHTRAVSILRKYGNKEWVPDSEKINMNKIRNPASLELIRVMSEFPDVIKDCSESMRTHLLPAYLFKLASTFNEFYRDVPVIGSDEEYENLTVTWSAKTVLSIGLNLLGIEAPEIM